MNKLKDFQGRPNAASISTARNNKRKSFYHSQKWRKTRAAYMDMRRKQHEARIIYIYRDNPGKNDPQCIVDFLESDLPLCEENLRNGIIKLANVVDHITPISDGGSKRDFRNLQVLTQAEHARKTNRENNLTPGKHF